MVGPLVVHVEHHSTIYNHEEPDFNPLVVDADDILLDALSDDFSANSTASALTACMPCEMCPRAEGWSKIFSVSQRVACAVSFAAGLSLGMAIGACTLLHVPHT